MYHQYNLSLLTLALTTWQRSSTVKWCFLPFPYPTLRKQVGLGHVLERRASLRMLTATGFSVPSHGLLLLPQARVGLPPNPTCTSGLQKPQCLSLSLAQGLRSHLSPATTRPHVYQGPIDPRLVGLHYMHQGKSSLNSRCVLAIHPQETLTIHNHVFFPCPTYSLEGG